MDYLTFFQLPNEIQFGRDIEYMAAPNIYQLCKNKIEQSFSYIGSGLPDKQLY